MNYDAIGNELHEGEGVLVKLEHPFICGKITKIDRGSILAPGAPGQDPVQMPCRITFVADITCMVMPGTSVPTMFVIKVPKKASAIADASSSQK